MNSIEKFILNLLEDKVPRDSIQIIEALDIGPDMDGKVVEILQKLVDNYTLYRTKKGKYMLFNDSEESTHYLKGKFCDTQNDYGFVSILGVDSDIFIHARNTNGALDGDTVLVEIISNSKDNKKREGRIAKIIGHDSKQKVGEVYHDEGRLMIKLDDPKYKKLIMVRGEHNELDRLVDGDKILVEFQSPKRDVDFLYATFKERIGHKNDPDIDILSSIAECGFRVDFPDEVIKELETIPTEVLEKDIVGRTDLRDLTIFTIDGDDTKDIDDALSLEILENGNYKLGVHIADVSYYVKENSPIDLEARSRGTSVYLTDRVIPMIPHQLSNGICSLNPNVDRLATSCIMEIDKAGKVVKYDILETVIRSRIQMTYKKVNDILKRDIVAPEYTEFADDLRKMYELSKLVRKTKVDRGFIDFDTEEIKILVDSDGKPTEVKTREHGVGEALIEDFMILANETVANHIYNMELPSVYRVHGDPKEERLKKFLNVCSAIGLNIRGDLKKPSPKVIQSIINQLKQSPKFKVLSTQMLSCMDKAIYDMRNIGHFGIASKCYTHFTSPIRRYPDTTIHRLLKNYFFSKDGITDEKIEHFNEVLPEICEHSSERERASIECERLVDELKTAEYMESHLGEEFKGMISSCTNFGIFVQLDNLIEGLVPITSLNGVYNYDQRTESLVSGNKRFMIGDEVIVKCINANKKERKIDFEILKKVGNYEKE